MIDYPRENHFLIPILEKLQNFCNFLLTIENRDRLHFPHSELNTPFC